MGGFTLRDMIINGWPVLSILMVFSIISVTIICDRLVTLKTRRAERQAICGQPGQDS